MTSALRERSGLSAGRGVRLWSRNCAWISPARAQGGAA